MRAYHCQLIFFNGSSMAALIALILFQFIPFHRAQVLGWSKWTPFVILNAFIIAILLSTLA
jgi:hypothetical protein